ncbi:MAG: DUF3887 domain-containing protein [Caldisericaceae bacterium]|nr:DUF3887 domain-containing protein [Caldisericaceae bacterium]
MNTKIKMLGVTGLLIVLILSFGCAPKVDVEEARSYGDPMTENLLVAINENDYTKFSKDLDNAMKTALPESAFSDFISQINGRVGNYVIGSKEFREAYMTEQYINIVYKTQFTEESEEVTVRVVFVKTDGETKISGLWFDSPKLKEK